MPVSARPRIVAVDFDGCLCRNDWPNIGSANVEVIEELKEIQKRGNWQVLEDAVAWCARHQLYFDAVNENMPSVIQEFGSDTRKIFADEYWDDKAIRIMA